MYIIQYRRPLFECVANGLRLCDFSGNAHLYCITLHCNCNYWEWVYVYIWSPATNLQIMLHRFKGHHHNNGTHGEEPRHEELWTHATYTCICTLHWIKGHIKREPGDEANLIMYVLRIVMCVLLCSWASVSEHHTWLYTTGTPHHVTQWDQEETWVSIHVRVIMQS